MLGVIDYGVGNLFSLVSSLKYIGCDAVLTDNPDVINNCDRLILPGVGAFRDAVEKLRVSGLDRVVVEQAKSNKPLLGICLGMQLLFDKSYENGEYSGLSLVPGEVVSFKGMIPQELKIPQIGWNKLSFPAYGEKCPLYKYTSEGDFVYFVHSYHAVGCDNAVTAFTEYGIPVTASVQSGNVFGTQFHPEKSGSTGLRILKAFCEL